MMDRPLCRLCGERHYSHEPHAFKQPVRKPMSIEAPLILGGTTSGKFVTDPAKVKQMHNKSVMRSEAVRLRNAKRTRRGKP